MIPARALRAYWGEGARQKHQVSHPHSPSLSCPQALAPAMSSPPPTVYFGSHQQQKVKMQARLRSLPASRPGRATVPGY
eukprot:760247-Hanusia_phi.AAC.2